MPQARTPPIFLSATLPSTTANYFFSLSFLVNFSLKENFPESSHVFHCPKKKMICGKTQAWTTSKLLPCCVWTKRRVRSRTSPPPPPQCLGFQELAGESLWWTSRMAVDKSRGVDPGAPEDPGPHRAGHAAHQMSTSASIMTASMVELELVLLKGFRSSLDNPHRDGSAFPWVFYFLAVVSIAELLWAVLTEAES